MQRLLRQCSSAGTVQPCLRRCQPRIRHAQLKPIARNVRMNVAQPEEVSDTSPTTTTEDAFAIASQRLSKLLEEASWDSNEAVRAELSTYSPGMKLTFLTNCGSLLTLIAFGVSWITGEDPLGGVTLTSSSLDAAYVGALAAIPLVGASLLTRTTPLRGAIPLLEDLHATQAALLQPLLQGLNPSQLLIAASSTMLPTLLLLLPAMHGLAFMLSDMTSADVVQPVLAAGTAAAVGAQETGMLLSASSSAALAHVDLSQLAVVGGADITLAQTTMTAAVNPTLTSSQAVLGSHAQHAADSAASGIHLPWANPTHAAAQTPVSPTSVAPALPPAPAMPLGQGEEMWAAYDRALLGPQADAAAASSEAAAPSVWRALPHLFHSAALHKPALLPQGVPDLGGSLRDGLMGLLEPHTAYMVRNVAREALALLPAILSGFVAAYTVMRQVAPRRSQVWAIRDALMASDRYFRLTVSMSRGTAVPSGESQGLPTRPFQETITMESLDTLEEEEPAPGPVPATIPIHTSSASSTSVPSGLCASSPAPHMHRLQLVDQLACPPSNSARAPPPPSSAAASAAVSDAFHMHRLQLVDQLACPPSNSARAPPPPSSAAASAAVSDAFRKVAVLWLLTRRKVCQLAYMLTALNIVYFAILWQETNDLATPAVAAVISVVTELWLTQREAGVEAGPEQRL